MENDRTCKLEFLNLDDNEEYGSLSESDRHVLISISRYEDSPRVESAHSRPVQISTSREESVEIEFGCASEVFNSINAGKFNPSLPGSALTGSDDFSQGLGSNPLVCGGVVQQQQQHIHINNYTANLTYHAPGICQIKLLRKFIHLQFIFSFIYKLFYGKGRGKRGSNYFCLHVYYYLICPYFQFVFI